MLGYYVTTTDNGQLAYDIVRGCHPHRFSAILVDLVMPVCDGIEFVQLLRSNDLYSSVPVIIWSGLSIDELSRACQSLRGVHLMSKHGGVDSLVTMIRNAVS
jgi:CheY-like chemotaxis protein